MTTVAKSGPHAHIKLNTAQTPDALFLGVEEKSRNLILARTLDEAVDLARPQQTNPTLVGASANVAVDPTEWWSFAHNQTRPVATCGKGAWSFPGGLLTKCSTDNISNPPSAAQITAAFAAPGTVGAGFVALIDDSGTHANVYLVASDGTNWWYQALTVAT